MTISEIRSKAADLLESRPDAWCQGTFYEERLAGRYSWCIVGACLEVLHYYDSEDSPDIYNLACAAAYAAARGDAFAWNDTPGRTREEVIAALRGS